MSERQTPANRSCVSFHMILAHESRNVPQMTSMLGGYGRYAEFIFDGTGSHGKDYKHGEDGLTRVTAVTGAFYLIVV